MREFDPKMIRYMEPKTTNYAKTINIISTQTKKSLIIETPLMCTYGIEDGERNNVHDGKFKIKTMIECV
jgi:hypothetical protein